MQSKVNQFIGISCFVYEKKLHKVESVTVVNNRLVIKTNRQTFVKLESEIDDFYEAIDIRELSKLEEKVPWLPSNDVIAEATPLQKEIIATNERSNRISDKLEAVFNELSENPSDDLYKKAAAMVNTSNAIMNMQVANYKFLSLK